MQNNTDNKQRVIFKRTTSKSKTSKELNVKIPFEAISDFKRQSQENPIQLDRFDQFDMNNRRNVEGRSNYTYYVSKPSGSSITYSTSTTKKSNMKKFKKLPSQEYKHVTFGVENNNNTYSTNTYHAHVLKKAKSNYFFNGPNLNDIYKDEKPSIEDKEKKTELINRTKRNFTEYPKYEKTLNDRNNTNNNTDIKKNNDEENEKKLKFRRLKTSDFSKIKIGNEKDNLNQLNSEFSSFNYVKYVQATSVAGKKDGLLDKINQDSYLCEKKINGVLNFNIFGVMDGHGDNGHHASQFVSKFIINRIKNHPLIRNLSNPKDIYNQLKANGYQIIANIYTDADNLIFKEKFSCQRSGTTCVIVIQLEENIICANAGDSRAIMIYDDISSDNNLINSKVFPLSYDCKPENPNEKKRIYECGGTVEKILDDNGNPGGPFRVWIKGEDYPGLAMSRSIGDMEAKTVGVIPNPQIMEYTLTSKSKYLLVCSDGVWEFISNEEAMKIANKFYLKNDPMGLCRELTNKSTQIWLKEDICIDDITVVAVFF
jgi:serine/threonine protein phosphatase PrpC